MRQTGAIQGGLAQITSGGPCSVGRATYVKANKYPDVTAHQVALKDPVWSPSVKLVGCVILVYASDQWGP
jgi:hypothetical protein